MSSRDWPIGEGSRSPGKGSIDRMLPEADRTRYAPQCVRVLVSRTFMSSWPCSYRNLMSAALPQRRSLIRPIDRESLVQPVSAARPTQPADPKSGVGLDDSPGDHAPLAARCEQDIRTRVIGRFRPDRKWRERPRSPGRSRANGSRLSERRMPAPCGSACASRPRPRRSRARRARVRARAAAGCPAQRACSQRT